MKRDSRRRRDLVAALRHVRALCRDSELGYRAAHEAATDVALKSVLREFAAQRAAFVIQLHEALLALGDDVGRAGDTGTVGAALHRAWVDARSRRGTDIDKMLLEDCERAELAAHVTYETVLRDLPSSNQPAELRSTLRQQYLAVGVAIAELRSR